MRVPKVLQIIIVLSVKPSATLVVPFYILIQASVNRKFNNTFMIS